MATPAQPSSDPAPVARQRFASPIILNRITTGLIYLFAFGVAVAVYRFPEAKPSLIGILVTGSIFGTVGSAIMTMCGLWEKDALNRIQLDLDIFHKDIFKTPTPWRRWPFLSRRATWRPYGGDIVRTNLSNPPFRFDVGSHEAVIDLPSVPEDFYDLPVLANVVKLWRFRRAYITKQTSDHQDKSVLPIMTYECVRDIWTSILKFRIARYGMHLGTAFILFGVIMVVWHLFHFSPPLRREEFDLW